MQTFRVDIDLPGDGGLTDFVNLLSEYGSPRIVSYDAAPYNIGCATMVVEFTSYEDAVAFAQAWFCETGEFAVEYVETITV
jgi:hypothetical protein